VEGCKDGDPPEAEVSRRRSERVRRLKYRSKSSHH
jgi:hypothetical protein